MKSVKIELMQRFFSAFTGENIMRKKKIGIILAAAVMLLSACGQEDLGSNPGTSDSPYSDSAANIESGNNILGENPFGTETTDLQPPHEGMVRSRLTNEWVDKDVAETRPIAVIIPNEIGALPHYNLSRASVIYEANVEDRMSRMMAVFEDWQDLGTIGNIRSLRTYYAFWAFEWDAFLVHSGGPYFIDDLITQPDTQNINDHVGVDSSAFFRDDSRPMPHNLFTTGNGLMSVIQKKGYSLKYRDLIDDYHYRFTDKANQNMLTQYGDDAVNAIYIDMSGCYPLTRCYFEYNDRDGLYYRSQHLSGGTDGPHVDAVTGEQLAFKNILVQYVEYEELNSDGYMVFNCHDNSQEGWYFTNGRGIHVIWEKDSDYGATRYYDDYGNEIFMNTGKTMVCIVLDGDNFTFR